MRFHVHEKTLQRAVNETVCRAGIAKQLGCHTFGHYVSSRTMSCSFVFAARANGFAEIYAT